MTSDVDAARKVVETAGMRTPAEIVQWIREQPTIEQAVQVLAAHVRAVVEEKEAEVQHLKDEVRSLKGYYQDVYKNSGCDKIGPNCPGRCIARCEDIDNLNASLARFRAALAPEAGKGTPE